LEAAFWTKSLPAVIRHQHETLIHHPYEKTPLTFITAAYTAFTIISLSLSALLITSCDERKATINAQAEATKNAIDKEKALVEESSVQAKKQTDINANIDKANIEANKTVDQAQLEADKAKADAAATAEKARLDALKK
jgi:PBP1b-binding outer membrane lipoprotein LpoB